MTDKNDFHGRSRADTDLWILSLLENSQALPLDEIMTVLKHFGNTGLDRRVDGWAELVQDSLIERQDTQGMLRVLALRCEWYPHDPSFKNQCASAIERAFTSRMGKTLFKNAGFSDLKVSAAEAVRRMQLLTLLEKGVLCSENTWGFGTIKRVDDFYARVTIDFEKKRGHEMALSYAAETLQLLPGSHLLVKIHHDINTIRQLIQSDQAALVRLALESYGPLNADELKDKLTAAILKESEWKAFWEAARKELKSDPLVHLPPKKNEPIRLLESPDAHADEEFSAYETLRDPEKILRKTDALETAGLLESLSPARQKTVADRLAFAAWGAEDQNPVLAARALLTAERLGVVDSNLRLGEKAIDVASAFKRLLENERLVNILHTLPVRMLTAFVDRITTLFPEQARQRLVDLLPELSTAVLQEAIPQLDNTESFITRIEERLRNRNAGPALLYWLFRHPEETRRLSSDKAELLRQGLDALEWPANGEMLKAQHQLRALYEDGEWLSQRLGEMTADQRSVFTAKLQDTHGWDEVGRRAVIAGIIKDWPELQEIIGNRSKEPVAKSRARMTSWRSYRERQAQFKHLVEIEIPDNAKEIGVARSYGDLRENAEFKYAKEHQRILYRRRDEMEQDLAQVKGTDFSGVPTDTVGMGTEVVIKRPEGEQERYRILGEWDRDETLNIISSLSQIARQLDGHQAGDIVELPVATGGMQSCTLLTVEPLGEATGNWLKQT